MVAAPRPAPRALMAPRLVRGHLGARGSAKTGDRRPHSHGSAVPVATAPALVAGLSGRDGEASTKMPRGFHPCFASQEWHSQSDVVLQFKSDGHTYQYTAVPLAIWDEFKDGSLTGGPWNQRVRASIGPYVRLS